LVAERARSLARAQARAAELSITFTRSANTRGVVIGEGKILEDVGEWVKLHLQLARV